MALTNKDIEKLVEKFKSVFTTKEEFQFLKSEFKELKNDVLNSHDEIMKKLNDMSTDKIVMMGQYRRHDTTIEDHEIRIKKIEEKVLVA
ncbi:hypothetical protein A2276_01815 [candidate division WOR-1 bacterium RIFOXYA12_FULL_43_27]|uniref:Uncharacterized protein n=1 Tax=candidate division WOR-1 bacterium RIFOXYC2_FULL_46_14 TaxID=1802587 RepID=A0A1F4U6K4_UNCSA|nr:MAG: hypothetical protein A2276_01815 [candidate division WOR-1 bacterium RIFOXYA12_FULL_43_27]OGC19539.1 MAG: hypothetical protein A2292_02515 [candidate division WOR-1 bacterium RIFOXYB2_FULL_46_45]OGC30527.1 MAG: hypothetical protein A2232_02515 [candidate division WOR-1 bacterium RIFOXYA2_FULL_46_56]OGC40595.1 MAG: hypothetical protein A2438_06230 [candidate division WOR-1 bacterium RIFOXYC2_FULL_46_14]